jgi:hypothetical protein
MLTTYNKEQISGVISTARSVSFESKKHPVELHLDENRMNQLLDEINELKFLLNKKTEVINGLVESVEEITWINPDQIDEETLLSINDIISILKDLHTTMIRQYVGLNIVRKKGIALAEIKALKHSMDDIKEAYTDLESVFFFLPQMPDFKETTKELSLI